MKLIGILLIVGIVMGAMMFGDIGIQVAEKKVLKYAEHYNKALEELAALREQQVEVCEEKLLQAVRSSQRSYKEIMAFITSNHTDDEWYCPGEGF